MSIVIADTDPRPSIVDVVSRHMPLKKAGKEYVGLCPFHTEKTPSFFVNEEKGLFHCFGCGEGGDVIKFVQSIEKTDFKSALTLLKIENCEYKSKNRRYKKSAEVITQWAQDVNEAISERLRVLGRGIQIARDALKQAEAFTSEEQQRLLQELSASERKWQILCDLQDDLFDSKHREYLVEMFLQRNTIERLVGYG